VRFWIDRASLNHNHFVIKGSLYHHICRVCKIQKGESFELFCEGVQKYEVFLKEISKNKASAQIIKTHSVPALKKPYLNLALAFPKVSVFEALLEASVQMGVKSIQPLLSDFSFFRKKSDLTTARRKRWEKILQHSLAQTGRTEDLEVRELLTLSQLKIPKEEGVFIAYESGEEALKNLLLKETKTPDQVWILLGSEGGFSARELGSFQKRHSQAQVFSMGDQILKVQTAGLFALSVFKYHYNL